VPLLPRYLNAPDSTYKIPPAVGLVEGAADRFPIKITPVPEPYDGDVAHRKTPEASTPIIEVSVAVAPEVPLTAALSKTLPVVIAI
jgi:hypothetical protein